MKFVLVIVAVCLAHRTGQNAAHGHAIAERATNPIQDVVNSAMAKVSAVAAKVSKEIVEANRQLHEYSDSSTDYAAAFRIDIFKEFVLVSDMLDRVIYNATKTANASNASHRNRAQACFAAEESETRELADSLMTEVTKCGITKVRQFVDLGIDLAILGNTTLRLISETNAKIQNCTLEADSLYRRACIHSQVFTTIRALVEISIGVSKNVATGATRFVTIVPDLNLCVAAKLFKFRLKYIEIPLTISMCLS